LPQHTAVSGSPSVRFARSGWSPLQPSSEVIEDFKKQRILEAVGNQADQFGTLRRQVARQKVRAITGGTRRHDLFR
jgi:hypothetical protein